MPMTPNIIQTMKHTVKANVLTISTDHARLELLISVAMLAPYCMHDFRGLPSC
jgi:hypothetical protein